MAAPMSDVFVGSETGLLKVIDVTRSSWTNLNSIHAADRAKEVLALCWDSPDEEKLCYGLRNREIHTFDFVNNNENSAIGGEGLSLTGGSGVLKGLTTFNNNYLTAVESGLVKLWNKDSDIQEFEAGDKLCCMRQNPEKKNMIATGGDENDLKIWNLENPKQPVFMAKNLRNDWLNLRVPIKVLDVQFVPQSEEIVTCTGYHQVRLYDPRTPQRRPVVDMSFDEYPIMSMGLCYTEPYQVVVGNTQGKTALLDFRKGKTVHKFKGFAGSVRSVQCHPSLPLVVTCGLDRFLRVHHIQTRELLHKFYLKSRLNCLLISKNWKSESLTDEGIDMNEDGEQQETDQVTEVNEDLEEDNDIWDELETVKTKKADKMVALSNTTKSDNVPSEKVNTRTLRQSTRSTAKRPSKSQDKSTKVEKKKKKS